MSSSEPDIPPMPEQLGTEVYDSSGKLAYSITKEDGKMVYRPNVTSAADKAEETGLKALQSQTLQRISQTPEEYTKSAQEEADAYAASVMSGVNKQAELGQKGISESMAARGMSGSRAAADTAATLEGKRLETASQVGQHATAMRDDLINKRIAQDVGLYNLYKSSSDANWAKMMGLAQYAGGQTSAQRSLDLSAWNTASQNAMNKWQAEYANDPWNKYISPTLTSAAFIIGSR